MSARPEYARIRRFLERGGVLQREVIEAGQTRHVVWCAAARDGRYFHAGTCEWLKERPIWMLDGAEGWLQEGPPGIFRRVPDIHPFVEVDAYPGHTPPAELNGRPRAQATIDEDP